MMPEQSPVVRVLAASLPRLIPILLLVFLSSACTPAAAPLPTPAAATPSPRATTVARAATTPTSVVPTPTPAPPQLTLWTTEAEPALGIVRALAAEFSTTNVATIAVVAMSPDALRTELVAADLTGTPPPDLIWGDHDDLAALLVDARLQPVALPQPTDAFLPAGLTNARVDDEFWGVPLTMQGFLLLWHNRDLAPQPPTTSDELIAAARAARAGERYGISAGWNSATGLLAWLNGFGGAPLSADGVRPTLDTPEMRDALNLLRELYATAPPGPNRADGPALLGSGQVIYAIDGDWAQAGYRTLDQAAVGVAPLPVVAATGRPAAAPIGGAYLLFPESLADAELAAAREFARFLTSPAAQKRLARALDRLPAIRAAATEAQTAADPLPAAMLAQADTAVGLPPNRAAACALRAINSHLPALLAGNSDQNATASAMQESAVACATLPVVATYSR